MNRFNHFFEERQKLIYYLIFVSFSFVVGIIFAFILGRLSTNVDLSSINKTQIITEMLESYVTIQIPQLSNSFFQIFAQNSQSGITVLLIPGILLLVVIYLLPKLAFLDPTMKIDESERGFKLFLKFMVLLISVWYAFHSFSMQNIFIYFSVLPLNIAIPSFSHAILEIPGMIIPSVMSLYIIDLIYEISQEKNTENKKKETWKLILEVIAIICVLLIIFSIAAYIECYITPDLTRQAFENYISNQ